jgi:hypothetical protein
MPPPSATWTLRCPPVPPTLYRSFSKMIYCDCGDGLVKIATVDKSTCLQAVPGDAGGCSAMG